MNKRMVLNGFLFTIAGLMVGAVFVTATNYLQLAIAVLLYPLLALFYFRAFPRRGRIAYSSGVMASVRSSAGTTKGIGGSISDNLGITDLDKRAFLKLIGGAGIALFLFSIFNKRTENLFFKSLPVPAGASVPLGNVPNNGADLAQSQPMDGYSIAEIDDNIIAYYGFTNKEGSWFIMKEDTDNGSFRYVKGGSSFPSNWANRTKLRYDYYNNVF